jgi:4-hydroxy-tetrahydrodipicolinate synthase
VSDEGLFAWYAALIDATGAEGAQLILYHIPQVTGVPLSIPLIRRLKDAFGPAILGVKDSAGAWENSRALLEHDDLAILIGDERLLARAAPLGGAGTISGMANIFPALLGSIVAGAPAPAGLAPLVEAVCAHPVTPAVKALVAHHRRDAEWTRVRPPLLPTPAPAAAALSAALDRFLAA